MSKTNVGERGFAAAQAQISVKLRDRFAEGLAAYRVQRWDDARRAFEATLAVVPDDGPSLTFIKRIDRLIAAPPGEGWDGACEPTESQIFPCPA